MCLRGQGVETIATAVIVVLGFVQEGRVLGQAAVLVVAAVVAAAEEGRGIFENIKKYLMYLLSANIGEIGLIAGAKFAGLPIPLTAMRLAMRGRASSLVA